MENEEFQTNVSILATMQETGFPVVSCYLNAEQGRAGCHAYLAERSPLLRRMMPEEHLDSFDQSMDHIWSYVDSHAAAPHVRGIVIFVRSVEDPFVLKMHFPVTVTSALSVDRVPHISQLMALKTTYDRYVVILMTKKRASIMEINLGQVTRQTWSQHPVAPDLVERGWSKARYQRHRQQQTDETIQEKIKTVDGLMATGDHNHLILAGESSMVERLKAKLPAHLAQKLVDTVVTKPGVPHRDVIDATLASFVQYQQQHVANDIGLLQQAIYSNGLGVIGTEACLQCLRHGRADILLLAENYNPGPAWRCQGCRHIQIGREAPQACPECTGTTFDPVVLKEEMVRLAEQFSCQCRVIPPNDFLLTGGGVGCLTRY